jgi:hypothetical protein
MILFKSNELSQDVKSDSNVKNDSYSKLQDGTFHDRSFAISQNNKYLMTTRVKTKGMKVQKKPIPSRIDYNFFNYCSTCELKYPKLVLRCKDCNQKVRTRPWHRSRIVDRRRI